MRKILKATTIAGVCLSLGPIACRHSNQSFHERSGDVLFARPGERERLLTHIDRDHDKKITLADAPTGPNEVEFILETVDQGTRRIRGIYAVSNLLQELTLSDESSTVRLSRIYENPVDRISRSIREYYWDGLTRRVDAAHLRDVLVDTKLTGQSETYIYVPHSDPGALAYFKKTATEIGATVARLPEEVSFKFLQSIRNKHGLLTLALRQDPTGRTEGVPFVVPGGRFNEMYGWDSYFEALGLLQDGRDDLARSMADNQIYEIENYGKILNANRSYYLNRSQPPFLTSFLYAVFARSPKNSADKQWLERGMNAAIAEYEHIWMNSQRLTATGLSRYHGDGDRAEIPPEVEPGHFDFMLKPAAKRHGMSVEKLSIEYNAGRLRDERLARFFIHDRAVRESGHDTTYRWRVGHEDRAADFVTVDLNSLLYKYELDIARWWKSEKQDEAQSRRWRERADRRRALMLRYLWDNGRKMFFDYNFRDRHRSTYVSATAFYPFWAEDPDDPTTRFLPEDTAHAALAALLPQLEAPGGLTATSKASLLSVRDRPVQRQWDYPNGWAPHQILAWFALGHHGMVVERDRIISKWLEMITRNAAGYNGTIPEKYDVVKQSHAVFHEYGNVGTEFAYITREGFGWMNSSYQVGLALLPEAQRQQLRDRFAGHPEDTRSIEPSN